MSRAQRITPADATAVYAFFDANRDKLNLSGALPRGNAWPWDKMTAKFNGEWRSVGRRDQVTRQWRLFRDCQLQTRPQNQLAPNQPLTKEAALAAITGKVGEPGLVWQRVIRRLLHDPRGLAAIGRFHRPGVCPQAPGCGGRR